MPGESLEVLVFEMAGQLDQALDLVQIERAASTDEASAPGVAYVARVAGFPRGLVLIRDLATLLATVGQGGAAMTPPQDTPVPNCGPSTPFSASSVAAAACRSPTAETAPGWASTGP